MTEYAVAINRGSWEIPEDHVSLPLLGVFPTMGEASWESLHSDEITAVIALEHGERRMLNDVERALLYPLTDWSGV